MNPAIRCVTPAALPEVGIHTVELPPSNRNFVAVGRINRDRRFVCCVADDVVAIGVDICLVAYETDQAAKSFAGDVSNRKM